MDKRSLFRIRLKKSDYPSRLLLLYLSQIFILTVARFILSRMGYNTGFFRNFVLTCIASIPVILFLIRIPNIKKNVYSSFFLVYLTIVAAFALTWMLHPDYEYFFTRTDYGLLRVFRPDCAIYAYLFFSLLDNPEDILKTLKRFAYMDFGYLVVVELLPAMSRGYWQDVNYMGQTRQIEYSLTFGYEMSFPVIIFLYLFMRQKNWTALVFSLIGLLAILTNGSRGALIIPVIFVGLIAISDIVDSKDLTWKAAKITGIVFLGLALVLFGNVLLSILISLASSIGLESRTLQMLIGGNISDDSGRSVIWARVIGAIRDGGLLGYGVFGDRQFVYNLHYVAYSHNIVLELICSFGIVGVALCIFLGVQSIRMIGFCKSKEWRELFIICFSSACQLFLSLSVWYVWQFWAAAAIAHKYFQLKKVDK